MARRSKAILKEYFGAGAVPTSAHFEELIDSLEDALAPITLTIVSGTIDVVQKRHKLETEGQASSGTLSTINGGDDGDILFLRLLSSSRTVTVDTAGNIAMAAGSFSMTTATAILVLMRNGDTSKWDEISRAS